jgi:hypothetical protein
MSDTSKCFLLLFIVSFLLLFLFALTDDGFAASGPADPAIRAISRDYPSWYTNATIRRAVSQASRIDCLTAIDRYRAASLRYKHNQLQKAVNLLVSGNSHFSYCTFQ